MVDYKYERWLQDYDGVDVILVKDTKQYRIFVTSFKYLGHNGTLVHCDNQATIPYFNSIEEVEEVIALHRLISFSTPNGDLDR